MNNTLSIQEKKQNYHSNYTTTTTQLLDSHRRLYYLIRHTRHVQQDATTRLGYVYRQPGYC